MEFLGSYTDQAVKLIMAYAPKLLLALIVLLVGFRVISMIGKILGKSMAARDVDATLTRFLDNLTRMLLKVVLVISVAAMVGVETTSFIAILGAAGLAVGLALQGSLSNFAGGVLLMIYRPYSVGDFIEAQGHAGTVHEIQIFNTILKTPDNRTIIIPNGAISNGSIMNVSTEQTRRVDFTFGIGYGDDIQKAREVLNGLIRNDERILTDPEPAILVGELADSSVNFTVRVWCEAKNYWGVHFDMIEKTKLAFDEAGISIPFPQQDVHIHQNTAS